jgi:anti-anti-sigma factor
VFAEPPQPHPVTPRLEDEASPSCEVVSGRDAVVVRPSGSLDMATVPVLEQQLEELREAGFRRLIIDLRGLYFIDSTGLRCILKYDSLARNDGFSIELIRGSRTVQRVFEVPGTAAQLPFIDALLRVVLIDDSKQVREAVAELIRNAGHEIVGEAEDGPSGVRMTLAQRPDLVIVDWRMPGLDGVEVTRRIRASHPAPAIVAYCSSDCVELRDAFRAAGAEAFVDKRDVLGLEVAVRAVAGMSEHLPFIDS